MTQYTDSTVANILATYERDSPIFERISIDYGDFRDRRLLSGRFLHASLRGALFDGANLQGTSFIATDLADASFAEAKLYQLRVTGGVLARAQFASSDFIDAVVVATDLTGVNLTQCDLSDSHFLSSHFDGASADGATLGRTAFSNIDLSPFCDAVGLLHRSPSFVDFRSVLRSCHHPGLKRFLVDCGVPPMVAESTIAAAGSRGRRVG